MPNHSEPETITQASTGTSTDALPQAQPDPRATGGLVESGPADIPGVQDAGPADVDAESEGAHPFSDTPDKEE